MLSYKNVYMRKILNKLFIALLLGACITLASCSGNEDNKTPVETPVETPVKTPVEEIKCPVCAGKSQAKQKTYEPVSHTPTTFKEDSVDFTTVTICEGVKQSTYYFTLNNGNTAMVVATEVDLKYASIAAGNSENALIMKNVTTPYAQATAFEKATGYTVVAAVNGDFFGGSTPVNAFVKDSVIIKKAHNDNRIYDYKNLNADLPASMPMLFGVSGSTAQIAPIIYNDSVEKTVKSELYYELEYYHDGARSTISKDVVFNKSNIQKNNINMVYEQGSTITTALGSTVLKLALHEPYGQRYHGEVIEIITIEEDKTKFKTENNTGYLIIPATFAFSEEDFAIGDTISYHVTSSDGTWKYYDNIIGCRQELVREGKVVPTVKLENSNGAQSTNIPRTAIGVMPDGKVVIFSVESLRYGKKSNSSSDPYGLNLPELADFMCYYGVASGANFDGGGSTQLLTRLTPTSDFKVIVRSSDTGSTNVKDTRAVVNTVLVYIKK